MKFKEYITNPLGKGNIMFNYKDMYRHMYREKLDKILVREGGNINYFLYELKDSYLCHIKIPSEVIPKFYYDTIIQFIKDSSDSKNLEDYDVKFFSNDPSFVYTFTHAFKTEDMFIDLLAPKMTKRALKEVAKERNPKDSIGYVKSIYFAYLYLVQKGLLNTVSFKAYSKPFNKVFFLNEIEHADKKIDDRKYEDEKLRLANKKEKSKTTDKKEAQGNLHRTLNTDIMDTRSSVNSKSVNSVSSIKTNKMNLGTVKKTKKR